jgi:PadR family transcriptional regulator, regulatory protein PadR
LGGEAKMNNKNQFIRKDLTIIDHYDSYKYNTSNYKGGINMKGSSPTALADLDYWKSLINIGLTKLLVLKVLSKGPNHGYGILKELQSITSGCCVSTFGTIYPILKELTKHGYAEVSEDRQLKGAQKRRVYTLTPSGVAAYEVSIEAWRSTIPYIYKAVENDNLVFIEDIKVRLSKK